MEIVFKKWFFFSQVKNVSKIEKCLINVHDPDYRPDGDHNTQKQIREKLQAQGKSMQTPDPD